MKIYLIAPKNPESFRTFDRVLSSLKKKCVFPNLWLPTVAGLTPREHEVEPPGLSFQLIVGLA